MPSDTHIDIEEGTLGISGYAFYDEYGFGCSGLTSVTIPNSVKVIGTRAFYNCSDLTDITFLNGATKIMALAFYGTAWYNNQPDGLVYAGKVAYMYKGTAPEGTQVTIKQGTLAIAEYAFQDCYMTSITIPNSVTSIGDYAFHGCTSLTSITIPNSVTSIGNYAFYGCTSLTSITIPNSVTSIGDYAFHSCTSLTSITIPNSVTSIGERAFSGCSSLTSITIPNSVTSIGEVAFAGCISLTSITIPNSVTNIDQSAFGFCRGLKSVTIGKSVTSIGDYAFNSCNSLTDIYCYADSVPTTGANAFSSYTAKVHVPTGSVGTYQTTEPWSNFGSNIEGYLITFADDNVKAICVAKWDTDGDGELNINEVATVTDLGTIFKNNKQISSFDELQYFTGLESIGNQAFYGCSAMTSIIIPENVTRIDIEAFRNCNHLASVTIPEGVTSIGDYAFSACSSLTSVTIPKSLTSIGSYAFSTCSGLTAVNIRDLSAWCNISYGNGSSQPLANAHHLYLNGMEVTKLNIPNGVTKINDYAFKDCTSITEVVLSSSVLSIGESAFNGSDRLTDVYIPSSMTSIDYGAFYKCTALTNVFCYTEEVPNTKTNAFTNSNFKAATLHVLDVAEEAFRTASPWKDFGTIEVISPYISFADQTVKDICIANWDINGDGEMTLEEAAAVKDLGTAFRGKQIISFDELQHFTGLTSISEKAFQNCNSLTSVSIPENVTSIGSYGFDGCSSLTSIIIPENFIGIGSYGFRNCSSLTSITIGNNVTRIGDYAFSGCKLRNVLIKCTIPPITRSANNKVSYTVFSTQTYQHAMLYVPTAKWDDYAFSDYEWCYFNNIRETALEEKQVSGQQAYTLMDARTFAYSVYDPVNDCIGTINSAGNIDENNPNHSWQMIETDGMHYLYNLGAKKYVKRNGNAYELTDAPVPIDLADGDNGLILGQQADRQWALVSNERLSVSQSAIEDVITGVSPLLTSPEEEGQVYNLAGQRLSKPTKGINIQNGRKFIIK